MSESDLTPESAGVQSQKSAPAAHQHQKQQQEKPHTQYPIVYETPLKAVAKFELAKITNERQLKFKKDSQILLYRALSPEWWYGAVVNPPTSPAPSSSSSSSLSLVSVGGGAAGEEKTITLKCGLIPNNFISIITKRKEPANAASSSVASSSVAPSSGASNS